MRYTLGRRIAAVAAGPKLAKNAAGPPPAAAPVVFSAIQPTGALHIGNYFGAVQFWLDIQNRGIRQRGIEADRCKLVLAIADLHALTTGSVRGDALRRNIEHMTAMLLATGLDESRIVLFQQSAVAEHTELAWLLTCLSTVAQLNRMSQFKHKAAAYRGGAIPAGLLTYPVLQAADILLYNAAFVPVGDDQRQHMEMCQRLARRFNSLYAADCLTVPQMLQTRHARVRSLRSPTEKMSKSDGDARGRIELTDDRRTVRLKLRKAVTDAYGTVAFDPANRPGVSNLVSIDCAVSKRTPRDVCHSARHLDTGRYKLDLAQRLSDFLEPIQQRYYDTLNDRDAIRRILDGGASRAREIASGRMQMIRRVVGLR